MIPTIDDILRAVAAAEMHVDTARNYLNEHLRLAQERGDAITVHLPAVERLVSIVEALVEGYAAEAKRGHHHG